MPGTGSGFRHQIKRALSDLVAGQVVAMEYNDLDRYQRILGKVLLDGDDTSIDYISRTGTAGTYP